MPGIKSTTTVVQKNILIESQRLKIFANIGAGAIGQNVKLYFAHS